MAIVETYVNEQETRRTAVTLAHYARAVQYSECAVHGVDNPNDRTRTELGNQCRDLWSIDQRNYILRYMEEAQIELENEARRLFSPTWVTGNLENSGNERLTDIQDCAPSYHTRWDRVIKTGRKVVHELAPGAVVDHSQETAVVGPIALPGTFPFNSHFVKVFYPGTQLEIDPSRVYTSGSNLYIEVPRCRMVRYGSRTASGIDFDDISLFQDTVDVVYWDTQDVNSVVDLGNGTVGFWYLAGELVPTQQQIDMIIRLAHAKMPTEPCQCEVAQRLWKADREIPDYIDPRRLQCPFGINNGSWIAWKWVQTMKILRLGFVGNNKPARKMWSSRYGLY